MDGRMHTRTHAHTHARTHGQRENSIPTTNKVCGGYNDLKIKYYLYFAKIKETLSIGTSVNNCLIVSTVLPAKSDSDVMFGLQSYQGLIIDSSLVY